MTFPPAHVFIMYIQRVAKSLVFQVSSWIVLAFL